MKVSIPYLTIKHWNFFKLFQENLKLIEELRLGIYSWMLISLKILDVFHFTFTVFKSILLI